MKDFRDLGRVGDTLSFGQILYVVVFDEVEEYQKCGVAYFDRVLDPEGLDRRAEAAAELALNARGLRLLKCVMQGKTLSEIARKWNISRQRVYQIWDAVETRLEQADLKRRLRMPDTEIWRKLPEDVCQVLLEDGITSYDEVLGMKPLEIASLMGAAGFRRTIWQLLDEKAYISSLTLEDCMVLLALDSAAYAKARRRLMDAVREGELASRQEVKRRLLNQLRRIEGSFNLLSSGMPEIAAPTVARDERSLKLLGLPMRLEHALLRGGMQTVGDVINLTKEDLLQFRNIGEQSANLILAMAKEFAGI